MNQDYNRHLEAIYKIGRKCTSNFELTDSDLWIYKLLLKYFNNDPSFEKENPKYSLRKGLLIRGNIGTGKTSLMKVFSHFNRACNNSREYLIKRCTTLNIEFIKNGPITIEHNSINSFFKTNGLLDKTKPVTLCLDDLGTEVQEASYYSNHINFMQFILLGRYDGFCDYGMRTYITSNLHPEDIQLKYGYHVRSRLKEMCNDIIYPGTDRRK
ncbi:MULTISPECIES: hypothetical protein [unclassified Carboxylicivirga]|uniref:hypothetical protein n=1 Tax=Carboxylicivirga TaxID=1628153 RepID=UPI003D33E900